MSHSGIVHQVFNAFTAWLNVTQISADIVRRIVKGVGIVYVEGGGDA
jgi:hypothetical protein